MKAALTSHTRRGLVYTVAEAWNHTSIYLLCSREVWECRQLEMKALQPTVQDLLFEDRRKKQERCSRKGVRSFLLVVCRHSKDVKRSSCTPIWNTILAFAWWDQRKPTKNSPKKTNHQGKIWTQNLPSNQSYHTNKQIWFITCERRKSLSENTHTSLEMFLKSELTHKQFCPLVFIDQKIYVIHRYGARNILNSNIFLNHTTTHGSCSLKCNCMHTQNVNLIKINMALNWFCNGNVGPPPPLPPKEKQDRLCM